MNWHVLYHVGVQKGDKRLLNKNLVVKYTYEMRVILANVVGLNKDWSLAYPPPPSSPKGSHKKSLFQPNIDYASKNTFVFI